MHCAVGAGALLCGSGEIPVAYDFIEAQPGRRYAAEGQLFGDADALRDAYLSGPCDLRLESGRVTQVVLFNCMYGGFADAGVTGPIAWD